MDLPTSANPVDTIIDLEATARVIAALTPSPSDTVHATCPRCSTSACGLPGIAVDDTLAGAPLDCADCIVAEEANPSTCPFCGGAL